MAGYFDERIATGTHDPLHAKAIVLRQGRQQIALVFCDLIGLSLNVTTNARAQASRLSGIPANHIMICATHTHTGPLFDDIRRHYFHAAAVARLGTDPHEPVDYPALLIERLAQTIARAQQNLRPAQLSIGIAEQQGITFNRRFWMKNGKVAFNPGRLNPDIVRPAGPADPDVGILLARDAKTGRPFAGATVFAMHSDTVGGTLYSADYAYYIEQTLRQAFGQSFISAFGLGTCGDLNHIDVSRTESVQGFEMAKRIGAALGQTVIHASSNLATLKPLSLAGRNKVVAARLQEVTPDQLREAHSLIDKLGDPTTSFGAKVAAVKTLDLERRGANLLLEVQVFRFAPDTAMVCLPGEVFVELGLTIKQRSPFRNTVVVSICNDRPSYIPTAKAFTEGSYEVNNSRVKPGTGELLVQTALELLNQLKR
jgi:hypothetical protein